MADNTYKWSVDNMQRLFDNTKVFLNDADKEIFRYNLFYLKMQEPYGVDLDLPQSKTTGDST